MLVEMARMSVEDGLVMQLHAGVYRNHNPEVFKRFGPDMGFDIPVQAEYTLNLKPLLDRFGDHTNFTLILFHLDGPSTPASWPPWQAPTVPTPGSALVVLRFLERHEPLLRPGMETAGLYNTVVSTTTRAPSWPSGPHDVWRRAAANWLAGLLVRRLIDRQDASKWPSSWPWDGQAGLPPRTLTQLRHYSGGIMTNPFSQAYHFDGQCVIITGGAGVWAASGRRPCWPAAPRRHP
jgi:glucuronate isomerase